MACLCAKSSLTLFNPMDCSPPGCSVHEIFQARILEWVAISLHPLCMNMLYPNIKKKKKKILMLSLSIYSTNSLIPSQ